MGHTPVEEKIMRIYKLLLSSTLTVFSLHTSAHELADSVRGLLSLKTNGAFTNLGAVTSTQALTLGSAFAVQTPAGVVWVTAAHVLEPVRVLIGQHYLLSEQGSSLTFTKYSELLAIADFGSEQIEPAAIIQDPVISYDQGQIGDFSQFWLSVDHSKGLGLRDLIERPLELNEPLRVLGRQTGKLIEVSCNFSGFFEQYLSKGGLVINLDCDSLPRQGQFVALGGVSGGAVVDTKNEVIGVFNGTLVALDETGHHTMLRATPLFLSKNNALSLLPDSEFLDSQVLNLPCMHSTQEDKVIDYLTDKSLFIKRCHLKIGENGFQYAIE